MNRLSFILWACLFPISYSITKAIDYQYCERKKYSDGVEALTAAIIISLYLAVGYKLW